MSPAGAPDAGAGAGAEAAAAGGAVGIGAAAGAADVGAVSIGAASDVIGTWCSEGTAPAADVPAAKPRPKSVPNDGIIGDPCNPGALNPIGGAIPPRKPPKPPISPCKGPIGTPPEPAPGKLGTPPPNSVVSGL